MTKNILIFFFIICLFKTLSAQTFPVAPHNWWIDKPDSRQDSIAIIKANVKTIKIYEHEINDSSFSKKQIGNWTLKIENGKIIDSKWNGKAISDLETTTSLTYKKDKIIELLGFSEAPQYKYTHSLNQNRQIIKTENKLLSKPVECRYMLIDWIEYKYANGLLIEALYYNKSYFVTKNLLYFKYTFEYSY